MPNTIITTSSGIVTTIGAVLGGGSSTIYADNVAVVNPTHGSNGSAIVGRLDKSFADPLAAQTAASSSQLVDVLPGTYSLSSSLGKNGVNWNLENGATITLANDSGHAPQSAFSDGGSAQTFNISGAGTIQVTGQMQLSGATFSGCLNVSNAGSTVVVDCESLVNSCLQSSGNDTGAAILCSNGSLHVTADLISGAASDASSYGAWWYGSGGDLRIKAKKIISGVRTCFNALTLTPTGDMYVESDSIECTGTDAVGSVTTQAESKMWINCPFIAGGTSNTDVGSTACAVKCGGGKLYIVGAAKLVGNGFNGISISGTVACNSGLLWCESEKCTATYGSNLSLAGGQSICKISQLECLGHVTQSVKVTGGVHYLYDSVISPTVGDGVVCSGGTIHLYNCTITTAGGKHDLVQSGGGTIIVHSGTGTNANGSFTTSGTVTYSPQRIDTTSSPTFAALTLSAALPIGSGGTGATDGSNLVPAISGGTASKLLTNSGSGSAAWTNSPSGLASLGVSGTATATAFSGDGSALTNLNGSNIATGTVADARLSSNVPLKNAVNTFTTNQNVTGHLNATIYLSSPLIQTTNGDVQLQEVGSTAAINYQGGPNLAIDGSGNCTATTFGGSGINLTNLPASQLVGVGRTIGVIVSSPLTTTSTTYGDVTGLGFAIAASETWFGEAVLFVTGGAGGSRFQMTGPSSPTSVTLDASGPSTNTTTFASGVAVTAFSTPIATSFVLSGGPLIVRVAFCIVNGANAGTCQLQYNSNGGSTTITIAAGSYLTARRIA